MLPNLPRRVRLTEEACRRAKPLQGKRRMLWDAVVPGLCLRINPSGRRSFYLVTRLNLKLLWLRLGPYPGIGIEAARRLARGHLETIAQGNDPRNKVPQKTVAQWSEEYLARSTAGERWKRETERIFRADILPAFGDRPPESIRRRELIDFLAKIADRAPVVANRTKAILSKFFNWLLDIEAISSSPAVRLPQPAREKSRERVLTDEEVKRIWEASEALGYPYGTFVELCLLTAARAGELKGMRWQDLDLNKAEWTIPKTKSGRSHVLPLSRLAVEKLRSLPRSGPFVFPGTKSPTLSPSGVVLPAVRSKVPDIPDWRLHDLRRTVATRLAELGTDRLVISRILGHREGGVTQVYDRYDRFEEMRHALEKWSSRF